MSIRIAPNLTLPVEMVTETFAILAKRGKGKTNTAVVMAEEMINDGHPVVAIDPIGVWWGLRSSADGKKPGLPVVIFGGDHGDVPLEEGSGEVIADVLIDQRFPAVIDLSLLSKAASKRFMAKFIERLYHRNRDAMHVIIDEADMFAPQRAQEDGKRLLGAMEDLVRRGRARGIGVTLITQRPAVLHKDVLTQAEVLIALGMTGPRDVAAIDEWVRLHALEDTAREVKASLPSLPVGTAWVWSPGFLGLLKKVKIRKRTTFDSSATPKPGEKRRTPKTRSEIDLEALGEKIKATVERAAEDDPKVLRSRIRNLEAQLAARPKAEPEIVEVPALTNEHLSLIQGYAEDLEAWYQRIEGQVRAINEAVRNSKRPSNSGRATLGPKPQRPLGPGGYASSDRPASELKPPPARVNGSTGNLGKTERTILTVLVQHGPMEHGRLALLSGYSAKASTIGVGLSKLRKEGLVEPDRPIRPTPAGVNRLDGQLEPLPQGDALIDYWRNRFGLTERKVLDALLDLHPEPGTQQVVAEMTDYSPTASTIGVALSKLRKVGVVDGWRISDDFARSVGL